MSKDHKIENEEFVVTPKTQISMSVKMTVIIFIHVVGLAIYGTMLYDNLKHEIYRASEAAASAAEIARHASERAQSGADMAEKAHEQCVNDVQFARWLENQTLVNMSANPSIQWTSLPNNN